MSTQLFYNGTIYSLVPNQPPARALVVRDGRIVAIGSEGKAQAAAGSQAEPINLHGRAVVPGLTDAHVHLTWHGIASQEVRLEGCLDLESALDRIRQAAEQLPAGAWLRGGGWNHLEWGGQWPTSAHLDAASPNHPAVLTRKDGHSIWVNQRALAAAAIDDETPDPHGGHVQRDANGRATGILLENAMDLVRNVMPPPSPEDRLAALRIAQREALSYGLTAVHIPPGLKTSDGRETLYDLQTLRRTGELRLRCLAHLASSDLEAAISLGLHSGLGDRWIRVGGLKLFADGSLGSESAEMIGYYSGRRHRGIATIDEADLHATVLRANQHGIFVIVHAIGDAANRKVLDAIAAARAAGADQRLALPNRIEHAQVLHPTDLPRFAQLQTIASMQPIHATADMFMAEELWGERCALAYAWRAVLESGATLAFGSDGPVETINPWKGIHAAVTRQRPDGTPTGGWRREQALSVGEALHAYCVVPAQIDGSGHERGTLQVGHLADFAVLSADPFRIKPEELHQIVAEQTYLEGQLVFQRSSAK